jgi:hypothetical protein
MCSYLTTRERVLHCLRAIIDVQNPSRDAPAEVPTQRTMVGLGFNQSIKIFRAVTTDLDKRVVFQPSDFNATIASRIRVPSL